MSTTTDVAKNNRVSELASIGRKLHRPMFAPLARDTEQDLWAKYRNGDSGAFERILLGSMRWIWLSAGRFERAWSSRNRGYSRDDLVGLAVVEAYRSRDRFKPELGYRYISYLEWRITRGCWPKAMRNEGSLVRIPTKPGPEQSPIYHTERIQSLDELLDLGLEPWDHASEGDWSTRRMMIRRFILQSLRPFAMRDRKAFFRFIGMFGASRESEAAILTRYRITPPKLRLIVENMWGYLYAIMARPMDFGRNSDLSD